MKNLKLSIVATVCVLFAQTAPTVVRAQEADLSSAESKFSYALGMNVARDMLNSGLPITTDAFLLGLEDMLENRTQRLTDEQIAAAVDEVTRAIEADRSAEIEPEIQRGNAMREEFAKSEGVKSTDSGILYKVNTEGAGAIPTASDTVVVHYRGTLIDGTEFDSSYSRNTPTTFGLSGIIRGWQEVLQLMPVGSNWTVVIPPELAYGNRGAPPSIPPGATLVFDIELLEIQ